MIPRVQKALGTKYPDTPEALVESNQKVAGPVLSELLRRYNELEKNMPTHSAADQAAIEDADTTDWQLFSTMTDQELGDVYSLQVGSPGAGDLQATPTGYYWAYEYSL
jgi:hypothetical protein